ncbi:galactose oxidase [Gloeophyllum trabeum ATCC 11539]|uniref:Galactose oxidase n=1 Tax=Gloeophyllum trabeum (strain ATCC 11539 / FP-39264 / Madison 617) TaxID=670483 RepID=S7Q4W2_GLOTA|nr:galactose oxidase [Gloeophyllum trabeum ATCC 11539]EPQ54558.1 galactose oxidase [Gloeophyllum trabeum ATCC 11539]
MHSISDLTTFCRKTTGDVPPKLVGASTTVVGSKMYLFGGRLVTERRMVADLYVFDLETFVWEKIAPYPDDGLPPARYFHSADAWNNSLIIFGGMGISPDSDNPEDLCVLNDVRFFDLSSRRWSSPSVTAASENLIPKARYAHLSSVTSDRLFIIGGQDLANVWLDDVHIYDLKAKAWIQRRDYPRHCGTYRSVAVASNLRVRIPGDEVRSRSPPGTKFQYERLPPTPDKFTHCDSLVHLPYSTVPTDEYPSDIYLYSNYNFTDVKRELEVFTPLPGQKFNITDRSNAMQGTSFPPGLRFPTGAILGTHLIIAGTYLAHTYQSFSVWALDLQTMQWSRIDPGSALATGSWFRGCLWPEANKFLIFGNRYGNLVEDYNRRLLSWDHVACIDLEAFGIYQPPRLLIDIPQQELGLAALEEGVLADFEIICDDGRRIECSRKVLEERWPWMKEQRRKFLAAAQRTLNTLPQNSQHVSLPDIPGASGTEDPKPDPRLTPRSFNLSEPYPIALAFVQYFYTLSLITPLQHAPAVLSQLLVLASTYKLHHLEELVRHAMHRALSNSTSVGVYEVATLCSCRSLQIR